MKIKALIFDLDGTLLNTIVDLNNSVNETYKYLGYEKRNTVEETMSLVGHGMKNLMEKCFPGNNEDYILRALDIFLDAYSKEYKRNTKAYAGIKELIDYLIDNNYKVGVNSNKNHLYTEDLIRNIFPNINIDYVTGIKENDKPKPDPSNVNRIIEKMNINKEKVLYIGDSPTDYKTAKNADLKFIGVSWGYRSKQELIEAGSNIIIDKPNELKKYL